MTVRILVRVRVRTSVGSKIEVSARESVLVWVLVEGLRKCQWKVTYKA